MKKLLCSFAVIIALTCSTGAIAQDVKQKKEPAKTEAKCCSTKKADGAKCCDSKKADAKCCDSKKDKKCCDSQKAKKSSCCDSKKATAKK